MSAIEDLKKIVFTQDFDLDSQKSVLQLDKELQEAILAEKLAEHPTIQKILEKWSAKQKDCQTRLLTQRALTETERHTLLNCIELCEEFISTFNGQNKRTLEQTAENYLKNARGGSNQPQLSDDFS